MLNKRRLVRPADALLPLGLLIAGLFPGRSPMAVSLAISLLAVRLAGLSSCTALRAAFATQPSIRKVCGSVRAALLLQALGALIVGVAAYAIMGSGFFEEHYHWILASGLLLNLEHCFYEYLYATGDNRSASLCRAITAVLVAAGILMSRPDGSAWWLTGASGISALVAAVIGILIGGPLKDPPNRQVVRCAPRAMLYTAAPLLFAISPWKTQTFTYAFAGWTLYELCKTPFRRSAMESRAMNRVLLVVFVGCAVLFGALRIWNVQVFVQNLLPARSYYYDIIATLFALAVSAALAFALFGSVRREEQY